MDKTSLRYEQMRKAGRRGQGFCVCVRARVFQGCKMETPFGAVLNRAGFLLVGPGGLAWGSRLGSDLIVGLL